MRGECMIKPLKQFSFRDFETLLGAEVTLSPEDELPASVDSDRYRSRCLTLASRQYVVRSTTLDFRAIPHFVVAPEW